MDKEQFFDPTHLEKLVGSRESEPLATNMENLYNDLIMEIDNNKYKCLLTIAV